MSREEKSTTSHGGENMDINQMKLRAIMHATYAAHGAPVPATTVDDMMPTKTPPTRNVMDVNRNLLKADQENIKTSSRDDSVS